MHFLGGILFSVLYIEFVTSYSTEYGDSIRRQTLPELVASEGYAVESHYVHTPDGYILNVHRIPRGKTGKSNKKVIYLQHGILDSSTGWVLLGRDRSLGYILADEGYDVWMGNVRGNVYSRNHTTLNPDKDSQFWQFSWHEMGTIDLPTIIDYVLNQTSADGIYYCGHSQGTTVFYVMASSRPEYNAKIKAHVSLAPIAFMKHVTSPLLKIAAFWDTPLEFLLKLIGMNEFLPAEGFMNMIGENICSEGVGTVLCENTLFGLCGFNPKQMNTSLIPLIMTYTPSGSSTKQFLHYAQLMNSGKFRQYDYGLFDNKKVYGTFAPPSYDLKKITAPTYLICGKNDWLAEPKDVGRLATEIGNCRGKFLLSDNMFNHLDFLYAMDAPTIVYPKVISLFSRH
ncbi:lipase 3-like [Leptinotarsa decemlineata]|uniref:lipase 3-like n=1 Tax=Leptinotarsa decemlineata TaxID=7539 RepID=UPI003D3045E3